MSLRHALMGSCPPVPRILRDVTPHDALTGKGWSEEWRNPSEFEFFERFAWRARERVDHSLAAMLAGDVVEERAELRAHQRRHFVGDSLHDGFQIELCLGEGSGDPEERLGFGSGSLLCLVQPLCRCLGITRLSIEPGVLQCQRDAIGDLLGEADVPLVIRSCGFTRYKSQSTDNARPDAKRNAEVGTHTETSKRRQLLRVARHLSEGL